LPEEAQYNEEGQLMGNGFEETKRSYGYEDGEDNLGGRNPHDEMPAVSSL